MNEYYNKYIKYKLKYLKLIKKHSIMKIMNEQSSMKTMNGGGNFDLNISILSWSDLFTTCVSVNGNSNNFVLKLNETIIHTPCINYDEMIKYDERNYETTEFPSFDYIKYKNTWYHFHTNENGNDLINPLIRGEFNTKEKILDGIIKNNKKLVTERIHTSREQKIPPIIKFNISYADEPIWEMYCESMISINNKLPYYEDIIIHSRVSHNENLINKLIGIIETFFNFENQIKAYMSTVKNLLDPITAKDSIKKIIAKCPWAIKDLPPDDDIINLFFITIFNNYEKYLIHSYTYNFTENFYRNIIPKQSLNNDDTIRKILNIIEKIKYIPIKEYVSMIFIYALPHDNRMSVYKDNLTYYDDLIEKHPYHLPLNVFHIPSRISLPPTSDPPTIIETTLPITSTDPPIVVNGLNLKDFEIVSDSYNTAKMILVKGNPMIDMPNFYINYKLKGEIGVKDIIIPMITSVTPIQIFLGYNSNMHLLLNEIINSRYESNIKCSNIELILCVHSNKIVYAVMTKTLKRTILYDCGQNYVQNWEPFKNEINTCLDQNRELNIILSIEIINDNLVGGNGIGHITLVVIRRDMNSSLNITTFSYNDQNSQFMGARNLIKYLLLNIMEENITISVCSACELQNRLNQMTDSIFEGALTLGVPGYSEMDKENKVLLNEQIRNSCSIIALLYRCFIVINKDVDINTINKWLNELCDYMLINLIVYFLSYTNTLLLPLYDIELPQFSKLELKDTGKTIKFPFKIINSDAKKQFIIDQLSVNLTRVEDEYYSQ